jgi:cytochrome P450
MPDSPIDYSPFRVEVMADPQPFYRRLRDEAPVYYIEEYDAWALSRFEDVWAATEANDLYTSTRGTTAAQALSRVEPPVPSINQIDPPDHTRLRIALKSWFTKKRVAGLEPLARSETRRALDRLVEAGRLDAVRELADPLAAQIACHLLSLPHEAAPLLVEWVHRYTANEEGDEGRSSDALAAALEMNQYLAEFVAGRRRRRGGEAIADVFIEIELGGRRLEDLEIASHLQTLVIGGTDTTPKVVATAIQQLARQPEQRARLRREPERVPGAFMEALRFEMPTQFMARSVALPFTLQGHALRPGQGVLLLFASANRDEREHPDPDHFDAFRKPRRNLGFGHSTHICLGAHVARLEGRVVLEELLARAAHYRVDEDAVEYRRADQIQGAIAMPLFLE